MCFSDSFVGVSQRSLESLHESDDSSSAEVARMPKVSKGPSSASLERRSTTSSVKLPADSFKDFLARVSELPRGEAFTFRQMLEYLRSSSEDYRNFEAEMEAIKTGSGVRKGKRRKVKPASRSKTPSKFPPPSRSTKKNGMVDLNASSFFIVHISLTNDCNVFLSQKEGLTLTRWIHGLSLLCPYST